jgi:hypothetical protein
MKLTLVGILAVAVVAVVSSCSDPISPPSPSADVQRNASKDAARNGYVMTPAGFFHRSCIHEIPEGALVDSNLRVIRKNGSTYQIPRCLYPPFTTPASLFRSGTESASALRTATVAATATNGYLEIAQTIVGGPYKSISSNWLVPPTPVLSYVSPQVYYTFSGLYNGGAYILQPVTQYGFSHDAGGGNFWQASSWRCDSNNGCLVSSPVLRVASGHSMTGSVVASACSGGFCTWTTTIRDLSTGQQSVLTLLHETETYAVAVGGAVEVQAMDCAHLPQTGSFFSGITLTGPTYNNLSPSWISSYPPGRICNSNVTSTATSVNLYHPTAVLSGPAVITSPGTYTYSVAFDDGTTRSYQWTIKWLFTGLTQTLGTASTQQIDVLSGYDDFRISVTVTSGTGSREVHETVCVFGCG